MPQTVKEFHEMLDNNNNYAFQTWRDAILTKFLFSMLDSPSVNLQTRIECMETIIRSAFDAGATSGASTVARTMIIKMLDAREKADNADNGE